MGVIVIGYCLCHYLDALGVDIIMCHNTRRLSHQTNHPMSRHLKYTRQIQTSFLKIKTPALGRAFFIAALNSYWSVSRSSGAASAPPSSAPTSLMDRLIRLCCITSWHFILSTLSSLLT